MTLLVTLDLGYKVCCRLLLEISDFFQCEVLTFCTCQNKYVRRMCLFSTHVGTGNSVNVVVSIRFSSRLSATPLRFWTYVPLLSRYNLAFVWFKYDVFRLSKPSYSNIWLWILFSLDTFGNKSLVTLVISHRYSCNSARLMPWLLIW